MCPRSTPKCVCHKTQDFSDHKDVRRSFWRCWLNLLQPTGSRAVSVCTGLKHTSFNAIISSSLHLAVKTRERLPGVCVLCSERGGEGVRVRETNFFPWWLVLIVLTNVVSWQNASGCARQLAHGDYFNYFSGYDGTDAHTRAYTRIHKAVCLHQRLLVFCVRPLSKSICVIDLRHCVLVAHV